MNLKAMDNKELELTEEQLASISGGVVEHVNFQCPHCGSTNIVPFHSPTKGTAYLCCDCYRSISLEDIKK